MDNTKGNLKILLVAALFLTLSVRSIIFIPPVIYIVTFSLGAFITNIFIFLAFWMAVNGLINRSYLGKPVHELIGTLFQVVGKGLTLIASALLSVLILNPITTQEVIISSISAGVLSQTILFLNSFRKYRIIPSKEKMRILRSITFFSIFVIIVTFISTSLALETSILYMNDRYITEDRIGVSFLLHVPKAKKEVDYYTKNYSALKETLWFYPVDDEPCKIYLDDRLIQRVIPRSNCYYYNGNREKRINCPVHLDVSVIDKYESGIIRGTGSCNESYRVIVEKLGFRIIE